MSKPNYSSDSISTWQRLPWATMILAAVAIALFLNPHFSPLLEYDRIQICHGQFWRILTSHWTHYSASHLFWDVLMFVVLGALCEARSRKTMLTAVGVAAILIPIAVWCLLPNLSSYRGLSGIDSALFTLAAVRMLGGERRSDPQKGLAVRALIVLFIAKIALECITRHAVFVDNFRAGFAPVPLAHLVGAGVGICALRPSPRLETRK